LNKQQDLLLALGYVLAEVGCVPAEEDARLYLQLPIPRDELAHDGFAADGADRAVGMEGNTTDSQ
jgi:hypothetical protein